MQGLRSLTLAELGEWVQSALGEKRFRADQIFRWVHGRRVKSFGEMTDLSAGLRERLAEVAFLDGVALDEIQTAADGTRKLRLRTNEGAAIESVLIPSDHKLTQCISSQVGCAVDCKFCATATLGFGRNLTAGEIVSQVYLAQELLPEGQRITNLVYMGMGEPLHNYDEVMRSIRILNDDRGAKMSPRKITLSTAGLVSGLEKLGREEVRPNLAVSLNATTDVVRDVIMPINKKWNIETLLAAIDRFPLEHRRRVTFEYVLLAGVNDSLEDAARLVKLLGKRPCKVNLIPWNPHPLAPYRRPTEEAIERFQNEVKRRGLPAYLRLPRGDDIDAACGQLAARKPDGSVPDLVALRKRKRVEVA
jgi:23S rRNA (adenine2503-C2)-methyltransferase